MLKVVKDLEIQASGRVGKIRAGSHPNPSDSSRTCTLGYSDKTLL